jgi:hypothetical protein
MIQEYDNQRDKEGETTLSTNSVDQMALSSNNSMNNECPEVQDNTTLDPPSPSSHSTSPIDKVNITIPINSGIMNSNSSDFNNIPSNFDDKNVNTNLVDNRNTLKVEKTEHISSSPSSGTSHHESSPLLNNDKNKTRERELNAAATLQAATRAMIARRKSFFHAKKQAMSSLGIQNFFLNSRSKEHEGIEEREDSGRKRKDCL